MFIETFGLLCVGEETEKQTKKKTKKTLDFQLCCALQAYYRSEAIKTRWESFFLELISAEATI